MEEGIYLDGNSARQYSCRIVLSGDVLNLYIDNEFKELQIWSVKNFQSCHLNGSSLIVKYGAYPHQTLECMGEIARAIYNTWSQKSVIKQAEGLTFHRSHYAAVILVVGFLSLGFFLWFYFLPWVGEKAAMMVPADVEVGLGDRLSEVYARDNTILDSATFYLQEFTDELELDDTYPIKVKVIQSPEINAFALPGGRIFVYSGIIGSMSSYEELVALLGHEVTHVTHRHSLKSICRSAASSIVIASLFGDITGISSGIISQADEFKELDYSRDLETEADEEGLSVMVQNKVHPKGMLALLELLKKESAEAPALMKYLSTHPETGVRIKNIQQNKLMRESFPDREKLKQLFVKIQQSLE